MKKIYSLFYHALPLSKIQTDDKIYILNDDEVRMIKNRERMAILLAAFFGAMGVILLIVPQFYFTWILRNISVTLFHHTFGLPVYFWIYSVLLVYIEIMLLTFLNIWCTHEVAVATGFLNYDNKHTKHRHNLLLDIGLEKKNKQILKYGIDPLQEANKKALFVWNAMLMLKATLSNMLFKIFVQRVLGRYAVQLLKDLSGIPIFAFWNAYGTHVVLKKAKLIIMGQNLIEGISNAIYKIQPETEAFKSMLYDTLQYIAISKRDFHENHYLLTQNLFALYHIEAKEKHVLAPDYLQRLNDVNNTTKNVLSLLIVTGFLLDGKISQREKIKIHELNTAGIINDTENAIVKWAHDFQYGKGIDELCKKYLSPKSQSSEVLKMQSSTL